MVSNFRRVSSEAPKFASRRTRQFGRNVTCIQGLGRQWLKWLDVVGLQGWGLHLIECTNCRSVTVGNCKMAIDRLVILKAYQS